MRTGITYVTFISALFLFSCKKEKSFDPNNPNGGSGGGTVTPTLLIKTVTKLPGNDSLRVFYTYDNQKRFISYKSEEYSSGSLVKGEVKFIRNTQGIVQKVVIKSDDLAGVGIDSIFYAVRYNTGTSRYTSSVLTFDDGTDIFRDSTAFTYNAAGKISLSEEFVDDGTGTYEKYFKTEYTYNATGNVIKAKNYYFDDMAGSYVASDQDEYEYDAKVNPLILGNEAFLLGDPSLASPNNQTKDTYTDLEDATNNDLITTTFTYNTANKPATDILTIQSESIPYPTTYNYQ